MHACSLWGRGHPRLAVSLNGSIANTGSSRRELQINGKAVPVDAEPAMPLLWVPRDLLNMTGAQALGTPGKTHVLQMGP